MGNSFGELAGVSAFLGGFVVTFLALLTTSEDKRRRVGVALCVAVGSAACLVLASLGWALLAAQAGTVASTQGAEHVRAVGQLHAGLRLTGFISQLFLAGVALLVGLLGISGSLRSRRVGIATALLAIVMALAAMRILSPFVTRYSPATAEPATSAIGSEHGSVSPLSHRDSLRRICGASTC